MQATAIVLGGSDVVRPLLLAGIHCVARVPPSDPIRYSRRIDGALPWHDDPEQTLADLVAYARAQSRPPVLYPCDDATLALASRNRARLGSAMLLPLADEEAVEDLLDKDRFRRLAARVRLRVPPSRRVDARGPVPQLDLRYPVVLKPVARGRPWQAAHEDQKAMRVSDAGELARVWPKLVEIGAELLAQEEIPGDETAIESYHAYIDRDGAVAGEFTGRKIRTLPAAFGESTAVEITAQHDVLDAGRDTVARLQLAGPCKADFKRAPDGTLHLLEVNPRFNLWHHPGALAGVNLPALAHADLTGGSRPPVGPVKVGVSWCDPLADRRAASAHGISPVRWATQLLRHDALSGFSLDDPAPFVRGWLVPRARRGARRLAQRGRSR